MPSQQEIDEQRELLATHRRTLAHYLRQRAQLSTAHEPPAVAYGIAEARAEIRRCKVILCGWGVDVLDHPADEPKVEQQVVTSTAVNPLLLTTSGARGADLLDTTPEQGQVLLAVFRKKGSSLLGSFALSAGAIMLGRRGCMPVS